MAKNTKKLALNDNKVAQNANPPVVHDGEEMVMVTKVQLDELIHQIKDYKGKYHEMQSDVEKVAAAFQKMFDELGLKEGTSKMIMFSRLTKAAKQILLDGDTPSWLDRSLLELLLKYSSLTTNNQLPENTNENPKR